MNSVFNQISQWTSSLNSSENQRFLWVYSKDKRKVEWKPRTSFSWFKETSSLKVIFVQMNILLKNDFKVKTEEEKVLLENLRKRIHTCNENFYKKHRLPIFGSIFRFLFGIGLKTAFNELNKTLNEQINNFEKLKPKTSSSDQKVSPQPKQDCNAENTFKNFESKIEHSFNINGKEIGKQIIERYDSTDADICFCKNILASIQKLKKQNLNSKEKKELEIRESFYNAELLKSEKFKEIGVNNKEETKWLSSNYFRHLLRNGKSFFEAIKKYSAAPINMRYQKLMVDGNETVGFFRVGVISDMTNGWFSIQDLERIKLDRKYFDKLIKSIQKSSTFGVLNIFNTKRKEKESANYALDQLNGILTSNNQISREKLDELIFRRRLVLEKQAFHLLHAQVVKKLPYLKKHPENTMFHMAHLGLLNPEKKDLDATGWNHNEQVEIEDMNAIFKYFRGKKLIFDGTGPTIEGNSIHFPYKLNQTNKDRILTLRTYFFNVSCQGYMENDGIQKDLNHESLKYLSMDFENVRILDETLEKYLQGTLPIPNAEKGFPIAEKLFANLLERKEIAASMGCVSAKDRTGAAAAFRVIDALSTSPQNKMYFIKKILDEDGPAVRVVMENTPGVRALKINPGANLKGFSTADLFANLLKLRP